MSTADNATITLAAQIGQHRPKEPPNRIAMVAGKLVKVCTSIRKRHNDVSATPFYDKAAALAKEIKGEFSTHIPYGMVDAEVEFYLTFDYTNHVKVDV